MRFSYLLALTLIAITLDGCNNGATTTPPHRYFLEAGTTDCALADGTAGPHAYTFVIASVTIDGDDSPNHPHTGFNLDGLFSGQVDSDGCNWQDFFSATNTDQNCPVTDDAGMGWCFQPPGCVVSGSAPCRGGIDNHLPTVTSALTSAVGINGRTAWTTALASHQYVVLLRVSNIDDVFCDPHVTVSMFRGVPDFGDACDGGVRPGRAYAALRADLAPGATDPSQALYTLDGAIENGRLVVNVGADPRASVVLPFDPLFAAPTQLALTGVQLRSDFAPTNLTNAEFGGIVSGADLLVPVLFATRATFPRATVISVFGALVDVETNGICVMPSSNQTVYGGVSFGFAFTAVSATISTRTPIADAPIAGMCGSPVSDAGFSG
jgi:hypothetical protein